MLTTQVVRGFLRIYVETKLPNVIIKHIANNYWALTINNQLRIRNSQVAQKLKSQPKWKITEQWIFFLWSLNFVMFFISKMDIFDLTIALNGFIWSLRDDRRVGKMRKPPSSMLVVRTNRLNFIFYIDEKFIDHNASLKIKYESMKSLNQFFQNF